MESGRESIWNGERNRPLNVYRPCSCIECSANREGVGYLSYSDAGGNGFTLWIEDEAVFRQAQRALGQLRRGKTARRGNGQSMRA